MSTQVHQNLPTRADVRRDNRLPPATLNLSQLAGLLNVGYTTAWEEVRRSGELAGIPALRIGRRYVFPTARVAEVLGLDPDDLKAA